MAVKKTFRPKLSIAEVFVAIAAVFGLFFVCNTPPLWGADETSHIARIYQLSEGHLYAQHLGDTRQKGGYGGQIPEPLYVLIVNVNRDLSDGASKNKPDGTKNVDDRGLYEKLGKKSLHTKKTVTYAFPNTAAYSPLAYVPALAGLKIADAFHADIHWSIIAMRLSDLLFFIAVVYVALKILANFRARWLVFVVALLPMTLFEASIITADAATNAVAILFSALIIRAILNKGKKLTRTELVLLIATTLSLPLLKPVYALILLALLVVPNSQFPGKRAAYICKFVPLVLAAVLLILWSHQVNGAVREEALIRPGPGWQLVQPDVQTHSIETHPFLYLQTLGRSFIVDDNHYFVDMLGNLGFIHIIIPGIGIAAEITAFFLAVTMSERPALQRLRGLALLAIGILTMLVIMTGFYVTYTNVGKLIVSGIQGRYFIPLLPLSLSGLVLVLGKNLMLSETPASQRIAGQVICAMVIGCLTLVSIKYYYITWG